MTLSAAFLAALLLIYAVPLLLWRSLGDRLAAPLVVVQILTGVLMGRSVLGAALPGAWQAVFTPHTLTLLSGTALLAVMLFVFLAGVELDLSSLWHGKRETLITAGCALALPLLCGTALALAATAGATPGWTGLHATRWQFALGIGMASAVTALPILVLFLDRLALLPTTLGQRILGYASLDDLAIWAVLAAILLDGRRLLLQLAFLLLFAPAAVAARRLAPRLAVALWAAAPAWLLLSAFGADQAGFHPMVGAFLAGAVLDRRWFGPGFAHLRLAVLHLLMPVFFLTTGLQTSWRLGGLRVLAAAAALLLASAGGKLLGVHLAARLCRWQPGEAQAVGWLLQTKALIMIIFASVLLDRGIIAPSSFTALLLMALASTALALPMAARALARLHHASQSIAQ